MDPLRSFGHDACDLAAASQQLALIQALYRDRPDAIASLLGDAGQVLHYVHQRDTWPPSWCVCRSGPGRYFVALAGTTNIRQALGHVEGSYGRESTLGTGTINGAWFDAWKIIEPDLLAAIPDDASPDLRLHLAGHSYGGAVALLAGEALANRLGPTQVEVMSFGAPKGYSAGYVGTFPSVIWRVESPGDIVPQLPPSLWFNVALETLPVVWLRRAVDWAHRGRQVLIGPDGGVL